MPTNYTPGPWYLCCDSRYSSPCLGKTLHSKKAAVHTSQGEKRTIASHVANWEDARLIAAAPDLLEACKSVLANLEWAAPDNALVSTKGVEACKEAIAKAEAV